MSSSTAARQKGRLSRLKASEPCKAELAVLDSQRLGENRGDSEGIGENRRDSVRLRETRRDLAVKASQLVRQRGASGGRVATTTRKRVRRGHSTALKGQAPRVLGSLRRRFTHQAGPGSSGRCLGGSRPSQGRDRQLLEPTIRPSTSSGLRPESAATGDPHRTLRSARAAGRDWVEGIGPGLPRVASVPRPAALLLSLPDLV